MPGTVLLLAASPVGRGRLVDAAGVLPVLAAVPPAVLSGTDTANVVELADPLEPQAVLTRLRAAAAAPGPLTLYIAGQLQLDRRQRLPHLALARTTAATVRYTGLPWHWIQEELRLRSAVDTALVVDVHADAEAWRYVAERGLDCGANAAVYGRVAPVGGRRGVAEPVYMKAVATLLRSGHRPPLLQLHEQALARIAESSAGRDLVLAVPGGSALRPPFPHSPTRLGRPEGRPPTAPGTDQTPLAAMVAPLPPGAGQEPSAVTQVPPLPGAEQVPPAVMQIPPLPGAGQEPFGVRQVPPVPGIEQTPPVPGTEQAPPAGTDQTLHAVTQGPPLFGAEQAPPAVTPVPLPSGTGQVPPVFKPNPPGTDQALPAVTQLPPPPGVQQPPYPITQVAPPAAKQSPRTTKQDSYAADGDPRAVGQAPDAADGDPRPIGHAPHAAKRAPRPGGHDPHAAISAAVRGGRHGDADVLAAQEERLAVRVHGPASDEALHWAEVRADLAMFAGDAERSCRAWLAVAGVRLAAGQAVDAPAVEAAVDRAHHQWGRITDAARARELGPELAELRLRVPGRRRGALENVRRQLRQLQTAR
ncbi:hypothetical protein [Streptomyces sp. NPDC004546]|uniref:hypothetical protein n=1 Tax=Streptomyces sp. NPDC004546 TaxID=3154282 RepID=UPI0033A71C08